MPTPQIRGASPHARPYRPIKDELSRPRQDAEFSMQPRRPAHCLRHSLRRIVEGADQKGVEACTLGHVAQMFDGDEETVCSLVVPPVGERRQ
jgi:hypothetical protein